MKINEDTTVSVIGLGYVGLPLAIIAASEFVVRGVDVSTHRLNELREGNVKIDDIEARDRYEYVDIEYTTSVQSSDIYIVCVPTPVYPDHTPDLRYLIDAVESIAKVYQRDQLVIIESTIHPGTCDEIVAPLLPTHALIAHCPERINPGDVKWSVYSIPRVVGANCQEAVLTASVFYNSILEKPVHVVSSLKAAESCKVLENTFRDVNIALVNEVAQFFSIMGIDTKEVISAAATKPFAFMPHYPGVGVGGHCIAVDPYYLIAKGRSLGFDHKLVSMARSINSQMPSYVVQQTLAKMQSLGLQPAITRIGIYGLAYKPNVSDDRESPSYRVIARFLYTSYNRIFMYDPFVSTTPSYESLQDFIENIDVLIVCTAHKEILDAPLSTFSSLKLIVDGRNCLDPSFIRMNNIPYIGVGR